MERRKYIKIFAMLLLLDFCSTLDQKERQKEEIERLNKNTRQGPPTQVEVYAIDSTSLFVTWRLADNDVPKYFKVVYTCPPNIGDESEQTNDESYEIKGLQGCQTCDVTVKACYDTGDGEEVECYTSESSSGTTLTERPAAPPSCTISDITATTMNIAWEKPSTLCTIVDYKISWTYEAQWSYDVAGSDEDKSATESYEAKNMEPFSLYSFAISGGTDAGYGSPVICNATTLEDEYMPPYFVDTEPQSPTELKVSWTAPPNPPNNYHITCTAATPPVDEDIPAGDTEYTISGLEPCIGYDIVVAAIYETETKESHTTGLTEAEEPPAPESCSISDITSDSMVIEWQKPDTDCLLNDYIISWTYEALWTWDEGGTGEGTSGEESFTAEGLEAYSNYTFSIRATTDAGPGEPLICSNATEEDEFMPPYFVTTVAVSTSSLNVSWLPPPITPSKYTIIGNDNIDETIVDGSNYALITGLKTCDDFYMTVTAVYNATTTRSVDTSGTTLAEVPPAPTDCEFTDIQSELLRLEWKDPSSLCQLGNYSINTTYDVIWSSETGALEEINNSTSSSYRFRNLKPYTTYTFLIAASTSGGYGEPLECVETTLEDIPGSVTITEVITKNGDAIIKWLPPNDANGEITQYQININGSLDNIENGKTLETTFTGLTPCQGYSTKVKASTKIGYGEYGEPQAFVMTQDVQPKEVICKNTDETSIEIEWIPAAENCPASEYIIKWNGDVLWSDDTDIGSETVNGATTDFTQQLDGLIPYTNYAIEVTINDTIKGVNNTCQTLPAAPSAPPITELYTEATTIFISWAEPEFKNGLIKQYIIKWKDMETPAIWNEKTTDNVTFSTTIENLDRCQNYSVKLQAETEGGGTGNETQNSVYIANSFSKAGLTCEVQDSHTIGLSWELAVSSTVCPVDQFMLDYTTKDLCTNQQDDKQTTIDSDRTDYTLDGLMAYSDINICLSIKGSLENPVCCNQQTEQDVPEAPTNFAVTDQSKTSITLTWTTMECSNGPITGWQVSCPSDAPEDLGPKVTTHICDNLSSGKTYSMTLRAINSAGTGPTKTAEGKTDSDSNQTSLGLIIGASVGGLLLIVLLAGGGYYFTKKGKKSDMTRSLGDGDELDGPGVFNEYDSYSNETYMKQQRTYERNSVDSTEDPNLSRTKIDADRKKSIERENDFRDYGLLPRLSAVSNMPRIDLKRQSEVINMADMPRNQSLQPDMGAGKPYSQENRRHSVHPIVMMKNPSDFPDHYSSMSEEARRMSETPRRSSQAIPGDRRPSQAIPGDRRPSQPYPDRRPSQPYPDRRPSQPYPDRRPSQPYSGDRRPSQPYPDRRPSQPYSGDRRPSQPYPDRRPSQPYSGDRRPSQPYPDRRPSQDAYGDRRPSQNDRYNDRRPSGPGLDDPNRRNSGPATNYPGNYPGKYPRPSRMYSKNLPDILDE